MTSNGLINSNIANIDKFSRFGNSALPTSIISNPLSSSFLFKERKGKINWRNIANLNLNDLIERNDLKTLENYLSNITYGNLDKEDFEKFGDPVSLKLFKLSQYSMEYLLNTQNHLTSQTQFLGNQYKFNEEKVYFTHKKNLIL